MSARVLLADDHPLFRNGIASLLAARQYVVVGQASSGAEAARLAAELSPDLILMDIRMVRVSGLEALEEIKAFNPAIPVILMTAYASVETAVEALKKGAYDYLIKPLDFTELRLAMERAMEHSRLKTENRQLRESLGDRFERSNLIGRSEAMEKLLATVAQVAP
jgi:two-component system response regulator HydG